MKHGFVYICSLGFPSIHNTRAMILNRSIFSFHVLPLTFILFLVVALVSAYTVSSSSNETDYQALLAFKMQITSAGQSEALSSWNESLHFCDWKGVTCGKRHRRVSVLALSSLGLVGQLSPYVGNLSFLRQLLLDGNGFHGEIPQEIGHLLRLNKLSLTNNSFEGELPMNLTNCGDLSEIYLERNSLRGEIPHGLGSMLRLTELWLSGNQFTGEIPPSLGNLSALRQLVLASNNLKGNVPPELGSLSNLTFLQISLNNLSGPIPTSLYNISSMEVVDLTKTNLSGTLPSDIFLRLPKLKGLYLSHNSFSGEVPASISNASQLVNISLSYNAFVGHIPADLAGLENLQRLFLGFNFLGTQEGDDFRFLTSLTNCSKINMVALESNALKGALPRSIGNFSATFTVLSLWNNLVSGTIPSEIGNLVNLERLLLLDNIIVGRIPESIGKLSKLQDLILQQNYISGMIPSSVGNVTSLYRLLLGENNLEGAIPNSIGSCTNLNMLDLSQNGLVGPVPEEIFGLTSLSIGLLLKQNNLTGPISSQIGNLVNLEELDVSGNNMSGEIPSTLGDCLVLKLVELGGNQFSGSIPTSISNLRGLELLDVSRNNLSGKIPGFLANLPLIQNLNLSFNMFEGEVPNGRVFSNLSAVSIAGNHKLCGGPPAFHLPKCEAVPKKEGNKLRSRRTFLIVSLTVSIFILLLLLTGGIIAVVLRRSKRSKRETTVSSLIEDPHSRLSYLELSQATNEFSPANKIGEGSFGTVYKGVLPSNGHIVAVKVLKLEEPGASKSFIAECEALRNIRHRNLVKTITCCSTIDFQGGDFKALVFEFMPNGNLDKWVHPVLDEMRGKENKSRLSALQRLSIAIDVATAVDYLHHQGQTPIVHSDLKPSNILLDSQFSAHVSDFGLAKFVKVKASARDTNSIGIRGTIGYIAPEYGLGGEISTQGDIYSFGILLLELFTGKRPTGHMFDADFGLREFVERAFPDRLNEVIDPAIGLGEAEGDLHECFVTILRVGLMCSMMKPTERMDIGEVASELRKARDALRLD